MPTTIKTLWIAILVAPLLSGTPAISQDVDPEVSDKLIELGYTLEQINMLDEAQADEVSQIVNGTEPDNVKQTQLDEIMPAAEQH